jgi:hypothetical protein
MDDEEARRDAALLLIAHCRELAAAALRALEAGDDDRVTRCIGRALTRYGLAGLESLICHWADIAITRQRPGWSFRHSPKVNVVLEFQTHIDGMTGPRRGVETVPPPIAWGGRFVAARAAHDEPTAKALLNVLWDAFDDEDRLDEVNAMLQAVLTCAQLAGRANA